MPISAYTRILTQLGKRIKQLREQQGLSQEQLADAAQMSRTYLAYLETGKRTPSFASLCAIADVLQVALKELFDFPTEEKDHHSK